MKNILLLLWYSIAFFQTSRVAGQTEQAQLTLDMVSQNQDNIEAICSIHNTGSTLLETNGFIIYLLLKGIVVNIEDRRNLSIHFTDGSADSLIIPYKIRKVPEGYLLRICKLPSMSKNHLMIPGADSRAIFRMSMNLQNTFICSFSLCLMNPNAEHKESGTSQIGIVPSGSKQYQVMHPAAYNLNIQNHVHHIEGNCESSGKFQQTLQDINPEFSASVYPNPVSTTANILIRGTKGKKIDMVLLDITGKAVIHQQQGILNDPELIIPLHVSGLANGTYFIIVDDDLGNRVSSRIHILSQ